MQQYIGINLANNCITDVIIVVSIFSIFYWIFLKKYNFSESFTAHGFECLENESGKNDLYKTFKINELRRRRRYSNLPPHYPNGRFAILDCDQLKVGEVREVNVLGENLVVWRGRKSGEVTVANAYCPHMGAHLGVGGTVVGDCIQCPFHKWEYEGTEGKLVHIPYSKQRDVGGSEIHLKIWHSLEANGRIFLWYHSLGESPSWTPEIIPEIQNRNWVSCGVTDFEISCHLQEIAENGADMAHLDPLHGYSLSLGRIKIIRTKFIVDWKPIKDRDKEHQAVVTVATNLFFLGWKLFTTNLTMYHIGPGIVQFSFSTFLGRGVMVQTVTPIEPLMNKVRHVFYVSNIFLRPLGKLLLYLDKNQIGADIKVWNRKTFLIKPRLVKEDKLILVFRRWFSQFYEIDQMKMDGTGTKDIPKSLEF